MSWQSSEGANTAIGKVSVCVILCFSQQGLDSHQGQEKVRFGTQLFVLRGAAAANVCARFYTEK